MLLLVAGLVVIVLVILVVVFLSVRSMRADEGNDHPARSAGRGRAASDRGDPRGREAGRQPSRRRPAEDDWLADDEPQFADPDPEPDEARAALPRPRGHRHDEDSGRGTGPQKRGDARRRQRQEASSRAAGSGRDKSGADWPAGDWGGVSDEQYWAELSADKPLATTARSAQAADGGVRPGAATWGEEADADPARSRQEPAPTMAASGAATAQFSLRPGSQRPDRPPSGPAGPPEPPEPFGFADPSAIAGSSEASGRWADAMSAGSVDTDPSIGMGGWQDAASDTAAWQMPGRDAPATQDARAWAEDPLTSPSFSESSAHSTDSRSYRGSHTRGRARLDEPGSVSDSSGYDRGRDYPAAGAWDDSYHGSREDAWRGSREDAWRGSREDAWRDSGQQYPSGPLDPLPGQPAAAEPAGGWYSAPTSPGGAPSHGQPPHEPRERGEAGYDHGSLRDPYSEPGGPSWPDRHEGGRYESAAGYGAGHDRDSASSGQHDYTGYDPARYDPARYDPAEYGPADSGYGQPDHHQGGTGYGQLRYGASDAGYRQSKHALPDAGYDPPGYDPGDQQSGNRTPDADYGLPARGSDAHGSPGREPGYAGYPGYDAGRR